MNWKWLFILFTMSLACNVETHSPTTSRTEPKGMSRLAASLPLGSSEEKPVRNDWEKLLRQRLREKLGKALTEVKHRKSLGEVIDEFPMQYDTSMYRPANPDIISFEKLVPIAPEGRYIVEPPIDTGRYNGLANYYGRAFEKHPEYLTDGFDFPVGKPDMKGYYIAQRFMQNRHLGDDFNSVKGGNSDLGDPVYSIGNGIVTFAYDLKGGWGNTIRVVHRNDNGDMVESLYSHLDELKVEFGQFVKRGELIGTIGTAHGLYPAHLHMELRTQPNMPLGKGYANIAPNGYIAPTPFIRQNRP